MPYARKYNRSRKFYRRSRKGRARRRFARKKFLRSPRGLKAGLYIPRQAYVKLPFTQIIQVPELTDSNYNLPIWGNGITGPLTTDADGGLPNPGDKYPLGVEQYAKFYQYYRVLGASCKIQINNGGSASPVGSFYCALVSAQGRPYDSSPNSNYQKLISSTTEDLISFPGCSWRLVSQQNGSRQNVFLKRFTKTKSILGVKDLRDNDGVVGKLPNTNSSIDFGLNPLAPDSSWFFLLRIDPNLASTVSANTVQIILKVKYYVQLFGRDYNNQFVVPSNSDE